MPLLITLGEPAGIGPDCVLRLYQARPEALDDAIIAAPAAWLACRAAEIGLEIPVHEYADLSQAAGARAAGLHCWNPLSRPVAEARCGLPSAATAEAVIDCIREAATACMRGDAAGLVTGPIEKAVLRDAGFAFPGHTEFLAHLAGDCDVVMMLATDQLRVALLTTHMALAEVPGALNRALVAQCIRITAAEMRRHFGLAAPRLALCALNPHAGEQGHFGDEEARILRPALEAARKDGINISGPLPSDTAFSPQQRNNFDAIICCYHDQGLIPIKALSFGEAVNVSLGLPFIRTSVDHGTALDRAGSAKVSYSSLEAALQLARRMAENERRGG